VHSYELGIQSEHRFVTNPLDTEFDLLFFSHCYPHSFCSGRAARGKKSTGEMSILSLPTGALLGCQEAFRDFWRTLGSWQEPRASRDRTRQRNRGILIAGDAASTLAHNAPDDVGAVHLVVSYSAFPAVFPAGCSPV